MKLEEFKNVISASDNAIKVLTSINHPDVLEFTNRLIERFNEFKVGGDVLSKDSETLKLGVVGQVKAGKSSFLNSLFFDGEDVLPKASTPMTAGLTVLEYADTNELEVEYYTKDEWNSFILLNEKYTDALAAVRKANPDAPESVIKVELNKKVSEQMVSAHELVEMCSQSAKSKVGTSADRVPFNGTKGIQAKLNEYVGANGVYTPVVKSLYIHLNDDRLKGIRIVDTPGVNDPIQSRGNRTNEFLESCHAVFFLSYAGRFLDATDVRFMNERVGGKGIGTVLLLASKFDSVLQDLGYQYQGTSHEGNIAYAVKEAQSSEQMLLNQHRSEFTNPQLADKIILDFNAGIGYSLYKKSESEYDNVEKNVVEQFKKFYPSVFEGDVKEFFKTLSNIDTIRDEYLNKVFVAKKETIIQQKIDEYFSKQSDEIGEIVMEATEAMNSKLHQLETIGLKDILEQKTKQEKLFSGLSGFLSNLISEFQNGLQNKLDELYEDINTPKLYDVPVSQDSVSVTYVDNGLIWDSDEKDNFPVNQIDSYSLRNTMIASASKYVEDWRSGWKQFFDSAKKKMEEATISKMGEIGNSDSKFDDTYFYNLIRAALQDIDACRTLNVRDTLDGFESSIQKICDDQSLRVTDQKFDCYKSHVQGKLDDISRNLEVRVRDSVNEQIKPFVSTVKSAAKKNADKAVKELEKLKSGIVDKLKGEGQAKLDQLEAEIKDKENTQKIINQALIQLKIVEGSFSKK